MSETLLNTLLKEAQEAIKQNTEKASLEAWKDNVFLEKIYEEVEEDKVLV